MYVFYLVEGYWFSHILFFILFFSIQRIGWGIKIDQNKKNEKEERN